MKKNKVMMNFVIEKDFVEEINEFRHKNRFDTKAMAIKFLLNWALKNYKTITPPPVAMPSEQTTNP